MCSHRDNMQAVVDCNGSSSSSNNNNNSNSNDNNVLRQRCNATAINEPQHHESSARVIVADADDISSSTSCNDVAEIVDNTALSCPPMSPTTSSSIIGVPSLTQNGATEMRPRLLLPPIKSASFSTFAEQQNRPMTAPILRANTSTTSPTTTTITATPSSSSSSTSTSSSSSSTSSSRSLGSATVAIAPIISGVQLPRFDGAADLLQWKDMPPYLQFNPYVLNGYRPLQTFRGCLCSLFYWHNETINILTHAIPIVYILAIVPGLMPWDRGYNFLSFCHVFGSVAPWCGSFVYHLFMNIERGENVYYHLLKLDMVGIWVSQSFGALPLVTATTFCLTNKWKWLIIASYCLLSLWGLYKALTASSPWQRRLCFALPFAMRSILTFFRALGLVGGNRMAMSHVYLQDGVSIVGGAIGAMRIPEKWFPGLVDFYLNSHNIMHVLVVIAVYSMHKATIKDFEWMSTTNCETFTNATSKTIENTFSGDVEL